MTISLLRFERNGKHQHGRHFGGYNGLPHQPLEKFLKYPRIRVAHLSHCGDWSSMELIEFQSKKDGKTRRAWKCQACDKWHFPNKK